MNGSTKCDVRTHRWLISCHAFPVRLNEIIQHKGTETKREVHNFSLSLCAFVLNNFLALLFVFSFFEKDSSLLYNHTG